MRVAILTANTAVYREQEEDRGGKAIKKMVEKAGEQVVFMKAVPNGETMIVNLPGKEGAVKAALEYLLPEIQHAVKVIKGEV